MDKKGSVLMYALFLVNIALIMAVVVLNFSSSIFNNNAYYKTVASLQEKINKKATLAFNYVREVNSNGNGYTDNISCPTGITMSGTTLKTFGITSTIQYLTGNVLCQGIYQEKLFQIYFNTGFTDFSWATYNEDTITLVNGSGTTNFPTDNTKMTFSTVWLAGIDNVDDDFNSDDYTENSTGAILYSNNFTDDDADAKKIIYGFVQTGTLANIFWNNAVNQAFISANSNNTGTLTLNMGSVSAGNLFLSIDRRFYMKLVKFSRATFTGSNELMATQVLETTQSGATGYIQDTGLLSTGGMTKTGNEYVFDFTNNDYALFLSNSATWTLFFQLKGYTSAGTGIYITPIDDSQPWLIRYLGSDIVIDSEQRYSYKQQEIVSKK